MTALPVTTLLFREFVYVFWRPRRSA